MKQIARASRYPVRWSARFGHKTEGVTTGRIMDISVSGVRLLSRSPYSSGDLVEVEAYLDRRQECRIVVSIVREQSCGEGWYCYGAAYEGMPLSSRRILLDRLTVIDGNAS